MYWAKPREHKRPPAKSNYIGHVFGSLAVCGYLGNQLWEVKCSCGFYTFRNQKDVIKADPADQCPHCLIALLEKNNSAILG